MYYLGVYYFDLHDKEGIKYIKSSANKGDPNAQYFLAMMNFYGIGIQINYSQAYWYNHHSIMQSNHDGLFLHSMFFFHGIVVEQDFPKAMEILKLP